MEPTHRGVMAGLLICFAGCSTSPDDSAGSDPYADEVVNFTPGPGAGFGQNLLPDVVLGAPEGAGDKAGSLDVLSLGQEGSIVLAFRDSIPVDGEGPDLLVFENPMIGWVETGIVGASEDGKNWLEWPCDADDAKGGWPGCAGVNPVQGVTDTTDPESIGGDAFDLAVLGLSSAPFIRIRDSGLNAYTEPAGGFDLDALAVVNGVRAWGD